VLGTVLSLLVALWLARFALDAFLFPPEQGTYYYSSRSMVSVMSVGEDGQTRSSVKQDTRIQTNIPGLRSTERSNESPGVPMLPPGFFEPFP